MGAAVAITLGVGGASLTQARLDTGEKPVFVAIEPCRLIDTRPANQIGPKSTPLGPNETVTLRVTGATGQCTGIPADATAAAMNVTAIQPSTQSFLTLYPSGTDRPNASNLNWAAGDPPTPNKVDVALGADGAVEIFNSVGTVHLATDLVGYYVDHTHDDRYFTQSQSDERYVQEAEADFYGFGGTLLSALLSGAASRGGSEVSFPDTGTPGMLISFGLPANRNPSRPITVQIPFYGTPNCAFVLTAEGVAGPTIASGGFGNGSWTVMGTTGGAVQLGPAAPGSFNASKIVTFRFDQASQFSGGASVELRLIRSTADPSDTCGYVNAMGGFSVGY